MWMFVVCCHIVCNFKIFILYMKISWFVHIFLDDIDAWSIVDWRRDSVIQAPIGTNWCVAWVRRYNQSCSYVYAINKKCDIFCVWSLFHLVELMISGFTWKILTFHMKDPKSSLIICKVIMPGEKRKRCSYDARFKRPNN